MLQGLPAIQTISFPFDFLLSRRCNFPVFGLFFYGTALPLGKGMSVASSSFHGKSAKGFAVWLCNFRLSTSPLENCQEESL
jgi:hypothetical protein